VLDDRCVVYDEASALACTLCWNLRWTDHALVFRSHASSGTGICPSNRSCGASRWISWAGCRVRLALMKLCVRPS